MHISFIEIQNFRKLKSVRLDFSDRITLCVGANNSGKTSAMVALGHFLINPKRFTTNDFTLSDWRIFNDIGAQWEKRDLTGDERAAITELESVLPTLDLWMEVNDSQIHYARELLPSLDWKGEQLGVRLRFEPKSVPELAKAYVAARQVAIATKEAASKAGPSGASFAVRLWPHDMRAFLERKLHSHFELRYYLLDPTQVRAPVNGMARPQSLPSGSEPLERNPLRGLIRIDEISAQRGLGDSSGDRSDQEATDGRQTRDKKRLSEQLKTYYAKHLDPSEFAEPEDVQALQAIDNAQEAYNLRLETGFAAAIEELQDLNYPGVFNPKLKIATRLRPTDGLNHNAAVQYDLLPAPVGAGATRMMLPEEYNGLGYQNLISMVFKLMSFRDAWMRVGKASKAAIEDETDRFVPPLHLVIVEEPEAYLHAQVQQVFVKKAYDVLRKRPELKVKRPDGTSTDQPNLRTQLIVSTHSSHVAHECDFAWLRYFRRQPMRAQQVPTSVVINLSQVFGTEDDTHKFVKRYLRATHCDLFFADAAILVEGSAERMLVPHFIRHHYEKLHCFYVTLLEIDGGHAHTLRELIEHLGLITLIITDLDSVEPTGRHKATPAKRGDGLLTSNATLKSWHPCETSLDKLLDIKNP
jgi:predicted ATP-dependent endonuclease of OLD family